MWILSWKKYTLSKFATFISIIGALMRYAGIMCLVSTLIPAALICIAIGIGLHFCAEALAKNKVIKVGNEMNITKTVAQEHTAIKSDTSQQITKTKCADSTSTASLQSESEIKGTIKCSNCGEMVDSKSRFCNNCGIEIK